MERSNGKRSSPLRVQNLNELPSELIFYICTFLDMFDLLTASMVNKQFYQVVDDCQLILQGGAKGDTWKEQYLWLVKQREKKQTTLGEGIELFNSGKYKMAISHMVADDVITKNTPYYIASFLRHPAAAKKLNKKCLGEFLLNPENAEITEEYINSFPFSDLEITDALRWLLSNFELPATQKLGPFLEKFSRKYFKQNPGSVFHTAVAVSNLAFAIILIVFTEGSTKRQSLLPMKKFIENSRGVNDGKDFSHAFLENLYDRIIHTGLSLDNGRFFALVKTGWMYIMSVELFKTWKKRWFVLSAERTLAYYKKPGDPCILSLPLSHLTITKLKGKKNTMKFVGANGMLRRSSGDMKDNLLVSTDTEDDFNSWIIAITTHFYSDCVYEDEEDPLKRKVVPPKVNNRQQESVTRGRKKRNKPGWVNSSSNSGNVPSLSNGRPPSILFGKTKIGQPQPYFGVSLEKLVERERSQVPFLVLRCTEYLERNLDEEGILRLSGSTVEMQDIRTQIEQGGTIDLQGKDPHAVAGILKSFFRELPEPIISQDINDGITAVLSFGEGQDVLDEMRNIFYSLKEPNFYLLKHLVSFLMKVASHSDKNKMTTNNLLRVITPTVNCVPGIISMAMDNFDFFFDPRNEFGNESRNGEKIQVREYPVPTSPRLRRSRSVDVLVLESEEYRTDPNTEVPRQGLVEQREQVVEPPIPTTRPRSASITEGDEKKSLRKTRHKGDKHRKHRKKEKKSPREHTENESSEKEKSENVQEEKVDKEKTEKSERKTRSPKDELIHSEKLDKRKSKGIKESESSEKTEKSEKKTKSPKDDSERPEKEKRSKTPKDSDSSEKVEKSEKREDGERSLAKVNSDGTLSSESMSSSHGDEKERSLEKAEKKHKKEKKRKKEKAEKTESKES